MEYPSFSGFYKKYIGSGEDLDLSLIDNELIQNDDPSYAQTVVASGAEVPGAVSTSDDHHLVPLRQVLRPVVYW